MAIHGVGLVADLCKEVEDEVADLQAKLKDAQQMQRLFGSLSGALNADHPSEAIRVLASHKKQLEMLDKVRPDAARQIRALRLDLHSEVEKRFQNLPKDFPRALEKVGLSLDAGSRHPNYSLLDEFVEVRFNKGKMETTVLPRDGRKTVLGVDTDVIAAHVAAEASRLTGRPFEPKSFLAKLTGAYQTVLKTTGGTDRANVPLKALVAELAKDRNFRADEFNIDLSKLLRDKQSIGRVALDNARDAKNGLLLWQLDQRGYYGYIRVEG